MPYYYFPIARSIHSNFITFPTVSKLLSWKLEDPLLEYWFFLSPFPSQKFYHPSCPTLAGRLTSYGQYIRYLFQFVFLIAFQNYLKKNIYFCLYVCFLLIEKSIYGQRGRIALWQKLTILIHSALFFFDFPPCSIVFFKIFLPANRKLNYLLFCVFFRCGSISCRDYLVFLPFFFQWELCFTIGYIRTNLCLIYLGKLRG